MQISWESVSSDSRFFTLKTGPNNIRILSDGVYKFKKHYFEASKNSAICPNDGSCLVCKLGMQANDRYAAIVLDLDTKEVKILEFGIKILRAIGKLKDNKAWGNPRTYDITIDKSGSGKQSDYACIPGMKGELTQEQKMEAAKQIIEKGLKDLSQVIKPATEEKMREVLGEVRGRPATQTLNPTSHVTNPATPSQADTANIPSKDKMMTTKDGENPDDFFKSLGLS